MVEARRVASYWESGNRICLFHHAGHIRYHIFNIFIYDITKPNFFLQCQLTLGDYFKEYEFAQGIAKAATGLIGWINNHGKVRCMFDEAHKQISLDTDRKEKVLAYVVVNMTGWTTHCVTFIRLLQVHCALQLEVMQHRSGLIKAQVGAATYIEKARLTEDAEKYCDSHRRPNLLEWS